MVAARWLNLIFSDSHLTCNSRLRFHPALFPFVCFLILRISPPMNLYRTMMFAPRNQYAWLTGHGGSITHVAELGRGAFGEVYKVLFSLT
jgi:hypothetical protein